MLRFAPEWNLLWLQCFRYWPCDGLYLVTPSPPHCAPILLLTSTLLLSWLQLWKCTALQGATRSLSSLIYLIWLDTNYNMPWFRELPFAKLSPLRSLTQRPWFMNTRLFQSSVNFFIETMQCQLSSKRELVIKSCFRMNSENSGNIRGHVFQIQSKSLWPYSPG